MCDLQSEYDYKKLGRRGLKNYLALVMLSALSLFAQPAFAEVHEFESAALFRDGVIIQFDTVTNQFDLLGRTKSEATFVAPSGSTPLPSNDDAMRVRLAPPPSEEERNTGPKQSKGPDLLQPKYQWRNVAKLEIAFQMLNAVDTAETAYCLHKEICQEANPLLSHNPSTGRLIATKAVSGLVHYAITRMIFKSDPEAARYWLIGSIIVQGGVVGWNAKTCF